MLTNKLIIVLVFWYKSVITLMLFLDSFVNLVIYVNVVVMTAGTRWQSTTKSYWVTRITLYHCCTCQDSRF